jgi:hypothetical protein
MLAITYLLVHINHSWNEHKTLSINELQKQKWVSGRAGRGKGVGGVMQGIRDMKKQSNMRWEGGGRC